jgi:hypothetical protein
MLMDRVLWLGSDLLCRSRDGRLACIGFDLAFIQIGLETPDPGPIRRDSGFIVLFQLFERRWMFLNGFNPNTVGP